MLRILIQQTKTFAIQHTRQYASRHRYKPNAGIRRQARAQTNEIELESTHWDDDLSKYEGDFTDTSQIYQQFKQDSFAEKEKLQRNIVRNKYFKEKKLAFLTWAEMEQIRQLNQTDPEEWNEHKLAESFPADAATIRKILKAKWQPKDGERVARHDEKVQSNWKSFADGKLSEIDPRFSEHLQKFSVRNLKTKVDYDNVLKKEMPIPKSTEFLRIITSCKKFKEEPKKITSGQTTNELPKRPAKEFSTTETFDSHKLYAFKSSNVEQNETVNSKAETIFGNPFGAEVKQRNQTVTEQRDDAVAQSATVNPFSASKYENNEVQLRPHELKQLWKPSIREKIVIPAKLFKEGATYRLEDCYYDDDGELLYRVPGMTSL